MSLAQRNNTTLLNDVFLPKFYKDKKWIYFLPKEVHIFLVSFGDTSAENQKELVKKGLLICFLKEDLIPLGNSKWHHFGPLTTMDLET